MNTCLRCGNEWESRIDGRPKNCPSCKSPRWDSSPTVGSRDRANGMVARAIQNGTLTKQPCEECGQKAEAHHDDYSKPLEVRWLCKKHHAKAHIGLGSLSGQNDIHIRGVSDSLLWALKRKAADEKLTLKALVVPVLEMLANSRPMEWVSSDGYGNPKPDGDFVTARRKPVTKR